MFQNRLELVKNLMQIMHITLIFILTSLNILYASGFYYFVLFHGKFWGFSS